MHLASLPWAPQRSPGAYAAAAAVAVGGVGAALSLAGVNDPATGVLTLLFLAVAPAVAVSGLAGGDRIARVVVAITGAIAVNGIVAEAMLILGIWSPRGGVAAVAAISALCVAVRRLAAVGKATGAEV